MRAWLLCLLACCLGCATSPARSPEDLREDIAAQRTVGRERAFEWMPWAPETFARARAERRFLLIDCAAEWCHWCHVMDETTYRDPEVGRLLREKFVAVRVDIDARPDIADRYAAWGWPATVLLTPDAEQVGAYKGYLEPERLVALLNDVASPRPAGLQAREVVPGVGALPWIAARTRLQMDAYWDPREGGWGTWQKSPQNPNVEVELLNGDRDRALRALRAHRRLIDPVWGGMYQYSAGPTWDAPHFEKLMAVQGEAIEAYARAAALTGDAAWLEDARAIVRYLNEFLSDAGGAFLVSQDADVNAHDRDAPFVDGHVFYAADDAGRRALGMPRIDAAVYPYTNGIAIAALCALHRAAPDDALISRARLAANVNMVHFVDADGGVRRHASNPLRFLADAAAFGRGLACLAAVTGDAAYRDHAVRIATAMLRDLRDPATDALWATTEDPAAAGVFTRRAHPFRDNVNAVRFLAALSDVTGDARWRDEARRVLAGVATPSAVEQQGRVVGAFLLALDEAGVR